MMVELARVGLIGIGATLVMDAWAFALCRLFGIRSLDYRLVGRWIGHFRRWRFAHDAIAESPPVTGERWLGWTAHYAIGLALAGLFAALVDRQWFDEPNFEAPLLFGLLSVAIPFLVMQPALGFGIAASRTPDPMSARLRSLATHAVFGLGLYLSAMLLAAIA